MPAKDYRICCALFNAYIGKTSKRNPNQMTSDRREISENEILGLIDWWLDKMVEENNERTILFDSLIKKGYRIEMKFVPNPFEKKND